MIPRCPSTPAGLRVWLLTSVFTVLARQLFPGISIPGSCSQFDVRSVALDLGWSFPSARFRVLRYLATLENTVAAFWKRCWKNVGKAGRQLAMMPEVISAVLLSSAGTRPDV